MKRTAFFISDSTGITAETLGESLLTQFENVQFERIVLPFIDSVEKAQRAVTQINEAASRDGLKPIVFDTVVNDNYRKIIAESDGFTIDIISTFLAPLEQELGIASNHAVGRAHTVDSEAHYKRRIEAMNYALDNDDGARINRYDQADVILIGVSRSGKTPASLYISLQTGLFAANYPLTEEDLDRPALPKPLQPYRDRLFGLTIEPERLQSIRHERRPNARYSSLRQCEDEVRQAEAMFQRFGISYIDTTHCSVEEIASRILYDRGLHGRRY